MNYNDFIQNILPKLSQIKSFKGKIDFLNQSLPKIGSGSGRIVYDIDGEKVIKLAKNSKGIAQNEVEENIGYYTDTHYIVTEIFDSADDNSWLISEKGKKVNEKRIIELTGIPNLIELFKYLRNLTYEHNGRNPIFSQNEDIVELLNENEFVQDLYNFIVNYSQHIGDMDRASTYGEVLRDGQPTIVLTDYGLNDEVYDTYYNPKRKTRMWELYNFGDGNDDILSNIGNTGEVRYGMWAQIPYNVGDGEGVINEEFIHFVSNRDYYPPRTYSAMPIMIEAFHECMNNIKEYIQHAPDKKRFYKNLLKLQEYLISEGCYNRDELGEIVTKIEKLGIDEDGSALYSFDDAIGQDNFPVYNNIDTSPSIQNDLNANSSISEIEERVISAMKGSNSVDVKKKCRLGGLGNTSAACNQGDIKNLDIKKLDEIENSNKLYNSENNTLNEAYFKQYYNIPSNRTYWAWITPTNEFIEVQPFKHMSLLKRYYSLSSFVNDDDKLFEIAINDGWVRVVFEYNSNRFSGELSINGYDKDRVVSVFKSIFFEKIKYGSNTVYLEWENPNGYVSFNTGDSEGKAKLVDFITENIDASEAYSDEGALQTVINGKRNVGLIATYYKPYLKNLLKNSGLNLLPIKQDRHDVGMTIVYNDAGEEDAKKLYDFMLTKGGYVNDQTPEEAYYIGKLLGYTDNSIAKYIKKARSLGRYENYHEFSNNELPPQIQKVRGDIDEATTVGFHEINLDKLKTAFNKRYLGWILPDNTFVPVDAHLDYLEQLYLTDTNGQEGYEEKNEEVIDKLYNQAFNDGLIRLDYQLVQDKPNLSLQGNDMSKIIDILKNIYLQYFLSRNSAIYLDIRGENHFFYLPQDKEKLMRFLFNMNENMDDYLERKLGIKPEFSDFEQRYLAVKSQEENENIIYEDNRGNFIIKNPKSLKNIGYSARGVIDKDGNLYVANNSGIVHDNILSILNKRGHVKYIVRWEMVLPTEFITVVRYNNSETFILGESNIMMTPEWDRDYNKNRVWNYIPKYYEAKPIFQEFINAAKRKNPQYEFENETEKYNSADYVEDEVKQNIWEARKLM